MNALTKALTRLEKKKIRNKRGINKDTIKDKLNAWELVQITGIYMADFLAPASGLSFWPF